MRILRKKMRKQLTCINWRTIDVLKNCSLALLYCLLAAALAPAQSINGRITGTITDQAGAVIRNADVNVINDGTGAQRRVITNENGIFVAPELPVGFYTIKVEGSGFALVTRTR